MVGRVWAAAARWGWRLTGAGVLGMTAVVGVVWVWPVSGGGDQPAPVEMRLVGAAADRPLFVASALSPGNAVARCVAVPAGSGVSGVRIDVADVVGALAPYLDLTVSRGPREAAADCAGFRGEELYDGPLTGLADGRGRVVGLTGSSGDLYRLTLAVRDDNAAQGLKAGGTFRWAFIAAPPGTFPTPAPPTTAPTSDVPGEGSGGSDATASPGAPGASDEPVTDDVRIIPVPTVPGASGSAGPGAGGVGTGPGGRGGAGGTGATTDPDAAPSGADLLPEVPVDVPAARRGGVGARAAVVLHDVASAVGKLAAGVVDRPAYPVASVLFVLIFLWVQRWIDRRDPKLALAPVWPQRDLPFPGSAAPPGRRLRRWSPPRPRSGATTVPEQASPQAATRDEEARR